MYTVLTPEYMLAHWAGMRRICERIVKANAHLLLSPYRVFLHDMRLSQEDRGGGMGQHGHAHYELLLFIDGAGMLHPNGQPIQSGTLIYHAPEELHAWQPTSRVIKLAFQFEVSPRVVLTTPAVWPCWPDAVQEMLRLFGDAAQQHPGWQDRARCHLGLLFSSVLSRGQIMPTDAPPSRVATRDFVTLVDHFLRHHLAQPLHLSDIASHINMSERVLTARFRQETGETVMSRLLRLRLERVNELLLTTDATLADIGRQVGIPDPSYLCRCYRKQYPISPRQYQRSASR